MRWLPRKRGPKTFRIAVEQDDRFLDSAIMSHGFAPYMRDYDVVIDLPATMRDGSGRGYVDGRYRYRFAHCPDVRVTTTWPFDELGWTWGDEFTDYDDWVRAGRPDGFVWGVCWALAYPGLSYISDSSLAASWTERIGREMHEVWIESNFYRIELVCHDLIVARMATGDPKTGKLTTFDVPETIEP
jgi:hypothetical protein